MPINTLETIAKPRKRKRSVAPFMGHEKSRAEKHSELMRGLANKATAGQTFLDLVDAYTIAEFCEHHRISRATYYVLKKRGLQPAETRLLDRIIITKESAAAWRRKRTAESRRRLAATQLATA